MILGRVNGDREAVIPLSLIGLDGARHTIEAIIDTGYSGRITRPPDLIARAGCPFSRYGSALLADGTELAFATHDATIEWDGRRLAVSADAVNAPPLIGMALMAGYRLTLDDVDGGVVTLEPLIQG